MSAALVLALVLLVWAAFSVVQERRSEADSREAPRASSLLQQADRRWFPDLDGDGVADAIALTADDVHFIRTAPGGRVPVIDSHNEEVTIEIGDEVTFTCEADGAYVQTFERPDQESETGPLRLARLELDGSVGSWAPSPSFFFGRDFTLPEPGHGCPQGT